MTMLRQQEKELKRTEGKLTRQLNRLNRQRADSAYLSLPTIALSEVRQSLVAKNRTKHDGYGTRTRDICSYWAFTIQRPVV